MEMNGEKNSFSLQINMLLDLFDMFDASLYFEVHKFKMSPTCLKTKIIY